MSIKHALSFGFFVSCSALFIACGGEGSGSAPASSGAPTSKPTATAAMTATAAATPTATATAAPTATAAAAAGPVGMEAGETYVGTCDSVAKDSECGELVIKDASEKARSQDVLKKLCKDTITDKPCNMEKMVGTCRVMKEILNHYSSEGPKKYTVETAKKECEKNRGKWLSP